MIQKILFSVLFIISFQTLGQSIVEGTSYTQFQIKSKKDTIDIVIADTSLNVAKPLLLFCQGSQPVPLFLDFGEQGIFPVPLNNFDLEELNKYYHVAVISMPKTPIIAGLKNLNKQYNYVTDTANHRSYSTEYLKADYSENYVQRANKVLKFLRKQSWIDSDKIVVAGHSQGARVAVGIAYSNKHVTALGLFGYNPNGRIDQSIRRIRKNAEAGKISWESFSKPTVNELVELKIPVYIAYGSQDTNSDLCDLLPLYFIENGKKNYFIQRYPNLEHNFFPLKESGRPDHSEGKWELVMNEFIKWTNNTVNIK